jgi:hypothetical protein
MSGHEANGFFVGRVALGEAEFAVDGFARAQELARGDVHFGDELAQLRFANRLDVVVDFLKLDAALTEQPVNFSTLGSSRFLVDGDFVAHSFRNSFQFPVFSFQIRTKLLPFSEN